MLVRAVLGPVGRASTYRRWAYLILGGAVLVPFAFLGSTVVSSVGTDPATPGWLAMALMALLMLVGMVVISCIPSVRVIEGTAARELLGDGVPEHAVEPARSWRSTVWFVLHLTLGGVVSAITLALPPAVLLSTSVPFTGALDIGEGAIALPSGWAGAWIPLAGVASLVLLTHVVSWSGALLLRLAPVLLGATPAAELAALRKRAERLAERNRLARDLHDSVGHALSVVTVQAAAARRVLAADPAFADRALGAIEDTARSALEDLDHVLGLLRDDQYRTGPQWTLADLPGLIERTGVPVKSVVDGDLTALPAALSRESYRIVQECLTNAVRHAGQVSVDVSVAVSGGEVAIDIANPLGQTGQSRGGGRGLAGMRERVTILRGAMTAGPSDGRWVVAVRIPIEERS